jgi:cytochrome c biogenesis protein
MTAVREPATAAPPPPPRRVLPGVALLRNSWRQLTSMRTALVLLFLLAVAAIPGSVLPQRGVNPEQVAEYRTRHPDLFPILDRIGAFEVFASPWFSAIYVLLFVSLVGCIVPRTREHVRALRAAPPAAPRRLDRLPAYTVLTERVTAAAGDAQAEAAAIAALLRRRRWRVAVRGEAVSAEKGYLKETGNLAFHLSLIAVLLGVATGSWYGWHGNKILVAGPETAFCDTVQQYAETSLGPRVDAADLPPFCLELTDFRATYRESGQPESFRATVAVDEGGARRTEDFTVNAPLRLDGASVHLIGHGYAPVIRYTDRDGRTQTSTSPFLTSDDATLTGEGVALFPDVNVDPATGARRSDLQVAFQGLYLPTAPDQPPYVRSVFPAERSPALQLVAYRGNLGVDAGVPGSVYRLDQRQVTSGKLKEVGNKLLRPGESWALDDGTKVEFVGTRPYVNITVRSDPGEPVVLAGAVVLLVGLTLSLTGRRRRVFLRVAPAEDGGGSVVQVAGLPRTDYAGFTDEFDRLVAVVRDGGAREEQS